METYIYIYIWIPASQKNPLIKGVGWVWVRGWWWVEVGQLWWGSFVYPPGPAVQRSSGPPVPFPPVLLILLVIFGVLCFAARNNVKINYEMLKHICKYVFSIYFNICLYLYIVIHIL